MASYLGIDLGTSSVKACLVGEGGELLATVSRAYALSCPKPAWKEIDPELWWSACKEAVGELLSGGAAGAAGAADELPAVGAGADVRAIGVTGQMHSTVFIDAEGRSIRPAIMWNDGRTEQLVAPAREAMAGICHGYLSRIVSCGSPALNLQWLRQEEPENFGRMERFVIGPDWIVYRLTGVLGTDFCEASTSSLFDLERGAWSQAACELLGVPECVLPEVRGAAQLAGEVLPAVAAELGLPAGVRVCVGTGDNPAAAIPTGCLASDVPVLSLGTSGVLMARRERPLWDAAGKNILFSFDGEQISTLVQGVVQSCGGTYAWWCRDILGLDDVSGADAGIDVGALGEGELLFYPHVVGEKTLYADPTLRGAFIGLSLDTTRADLTLAVMEGIAFGVRQVSEAMRLDLGALDVLPVIGGGARSRVWMQVLADVLGVPCMQMRGEASAGYGAALLAMLSAGSLAPGDLGGLCVTRGDVFKPDAAARERYQQKYARYVGIHDALKQI